MTSVMENLKASVNSCELVVQSTRKLYLANKETLKQKENELRKAKREFNAAYKLWTHTRKSLNRAKNKLSGYPSKARRYTKEHFGEVLNRMGK